VSIPSSVSQLISTHSHRTGAERLSCPAARNRQRCISPTAGGGRWIQTLKRHALVCGAASRSALTIRTDLEMEQMATTNLARGDRRPITACARREMVLARHARAGHLSQPSGRSIPEPYSRCGIGRRGIGRTCVISEPDGRYTDLFALLCHTGIVLECGRTQAGTGIESMSEPTGGQYGSVVGKITWRGGTPSFRDESGFGRMIRPEGTRWGVFGAYFNVFL